MSLSDEEKEIFKEKFDEAKKSLSVLRDCWDEEQIKKYPKYLPSFDEFVLDFSEMLVEQ